MSTSDNEQNNNNKSESGQGPLQPEPPTARKGKKSKAEANRENSKKSRGPTSLRGKNIAKKNSFKFGLYTSELVISEEDEPEYVKLRGDLEKELRPRTQLLKDAFDQVVVAMWHHKQAVREAQRRFGEAQALDETETIPSKIAIDTEGGVARWYGASRSDMRAGIRGVDQIIKEFSETRLLSKKAKEWLSTTFGPDFVVMCDKWTPLNPSVIAAAKFLVSQDEIFKGRLGETIADRMKREPPGPEIVVDPQQGQEMVLKLLELRRDVMKELLTIEGNFSQEEKEVRSVEINFRFLADSAREVRNSLQWYFYVREVAPAEGNNSFLLAGRYSPNKRLRRYSRNERLEK